MMRTLLMALLMAHVVAAQEPSRSLSVTGQFDSAFRGYSFDASESFRRKLPPTVRAIFDHFVRDETLEAVKAARALPSASASELAPGIATVREHLVVNPQDGTVFRPAFLALVAEFRAHVATLSRSEGAEPARELMWLENSLDRGGEDRRKPRMAEFLKTYEGTPAYYHQMIEQVDSEYGSSASRMRPRLRELAKEHDRTEYGAHALYLLAFRLAHDAVSRPPQPDPTERFVEVLSIVEELQSGRFPRCEWVDKAPSLILEFNIFDPVFAPGNIARMAGGYERFILSQLARGTPVPNMGFLMSYGVGQLKNEGENPLPLVERVIADLAKSAAGPDYAISARAAFYLHVLNDNSLTEIPITPARAASAARESRERLVKSSSPQIRGQALADLASMDFYLGRYRAARGGYLEFLRSFPSSDWAWVAALRAAEALEALGDVKGAAAEYEAAAARFNEPSSGAALARVAAADTRDASGDFTAAIANYKAALALWGDFPGPIMIYTHQSDGAPPVEKPGRFNNLTKHVLEERVEKLAGTATPAGALLYQGRRALDEEKPRDAVSPLQRLISEFPRSPESAEAPKLMRRARFEIALATGASRSRATELAALARDTSDGIGRAARMAEAALLLERGDANRAETMTMATLAEWHAKQDVPAHPVHAFDGDASAIRAVLLSDAGRQVLGEGWNAFHWPVTPPPYSLVNRDVAIKTPDGKESIREAVFAAPAGMRIIFASADDWRNLSAILDKIGGTRTREPRGIMETPNQPIGLSVSIAEMWAKFFHVRPGHWGGWVLTTYPYVSRIAFDREDHALVDVTVGYSGGVVEFEKDSGVWIARRMVSVWVT